MFSTIRAPPISTLFPYTRSSDLEVIATLPVTAEFQQRKVEVIAEIATAAGTVNALIGGQVVDILSEGKQITPDTLDYIHRSEEHTSELQSLRHLVCRLLLEKKKV